MEQEGKIGSRTLGLASDGRLIRISKDDTSVRFTSFSLDGDKKSFHKHSAFKYQRNNLILI